MPQTIGGPRNDPTYSFQLFIYIRVAAKEEYGFNCNWPTQSQFDTINK